jgi:alkylation response protein AidB-like acyl-CoA dehydrogenase
MSFLLSTELSQFASILEKYFSDNFNSTYIKKSLAGDSDGLARTNAKYWKELSELGALSAGFEESYGGLGFGLLAMCVIAEEAGKVLLPLPLFETVVLGALPISIFGTDEAKETLLTQALTGELSLSGAYAECYPSFTNPSTVSVTVDKSGKTLLSGIVQFVPYVSSVDAVLIPVKFSSGELSLYVIENLQVAIGDNTVSEIPQKTFDLLRTYSKLELKNARARLINEKPIQSPEFDKGLSIISLLVSGELIGVGAKIIQITLQHVKTRKQFGVPIGSFQAISHKLSDMFVELESARALVRFACWALDGDPKQFPIASAASKGYVSEYLPQIIETALQIHGGVAFTYEYELHHYLRRAQMLSSLYGTKQECYQRVGELR